MLTIVSLWVFCGIVAVTLATAKGHKDYPMLLSCLVLGPIGIVFAARKEKLKFFCPYCNESVHMEKNACSLCGLPLDEAAGAETPVSGQCIGCGESHVHDAYLENGSWGKWCPDCRMSIKRMREKTSKERVKT